MNAKSPSLKPYSLEGAVLLDNHMFSGFGPLILEISGVYIYIYMCSLPSSLGALEDRFFLQIKASSSPSFWDWR